MARRWMRSSPVIFYPLSRLQNGPADQMLSGEGAKAFGQPGHTGALMSPPAPVSARCPADRPYIPAGIWATARSWLEKTGDSVRHMDRRKEPWRYRADSSSEAPGSKNRRRRASVLPPLSFIDDLTRSRGRSPRPYASFAGEHRALAGKAALARRRLRGARTVSGSSGSSSSLVMTAYCGETAAKKAAPPSA